MTKKQLLIDQHIRLHSLSLRLSSLSSRSIHPMGDWECVLRSFYLFSKYIQGGSHFVQYSQMGLPLCVCLCVTNRSHVTTIPTLPSASAQLSYPINNYRPPPQFFSHAYFECMIHREYRVCMTATVSVLQQRKSCEGLPQLSIKN